MLSFRIDSDAPAGRLVDGQCPLPGPGQLLVEIRACALNFADTLMIKGTYQDRPEPPFVPGLECAGRIIAKGVSVSDFEIGQRVAVYGGQGGLAQFGVFDADRATLLPDALSYDQGAAALITYGSALLALRAAQLCPGERLLVTGAAGGAGLAAVEVGSLLGAHVVAQARGAQKCAIARAAGAHDTIDAQEDLHARLLELGRVDVVYDTVGGAAWQAAFRACNPCARLLPIGFAGGEVPQIPANHLMVKSLTAIGFYLGGYVKARPAQAAEGFRQILDWIASGTLTPHISQCLPLSRVEEGLDLLRSRQATGKVIIHPPHDAA